MRAEFYRPEPAAESDATPPPAPGGAPPPRPPAPPALGHARWTEGRVEVAAQDPEVEAALRRVFRPSPVTADDSGSRQRGASGPSTRQPGTFEWFRSAAIVRGAEEGLAVRFVAPATVGGWDPAANYRPFRQQVRRVFG